MHLPCIVCITLFFCILWCLDILGPLWLGRDCPSWASQFLETAEGQASPVQRAALHLPCSQGAMCLCLPPPRPRARHWGTTAIAWSRWNCSQWPKLSWSACCALPSLREPQARGRDCPSSCICLLTDPLLSCGLRGGPAHVSTPGSVITFASGASPVSVLVAEPDWSSHKRP